MRHLRRFATQRFGRTAVLQSVPCVSTACKLVYAVSFRLRQDGEHTNCVFRCWPQNPFFKVEGRVPSGICPRGSLPERVIVSAQRPAPGALLHLGFRHAHLL